MFTVEQQKEITSRFPDVDYYIKNGNLIATGPETQIATFERWLEYTF